MIYWYTGQPGHGKTLHGIDHAIKLRDEGRIVYVGNVTGFDYGKAKMLPITPEEFKDWPSFLPDGAVCLIDEAYEHGMLPKRAPGAKLPYHVEQLAKHRHRGIDFIFISQSPQTQCDTFVHDLIEQHIHVRRMYGLPYVWLRKFFYMERNPLKSTPNVISRVKLPKRPMGLYKSTAMDTTQRHIPWYVIALAIGIPAVLGGAWYMVSDVNDALHGQEIASPMHANTDATGANGAVATVVPGGAGFGGSRELRNEDYVAWLTPRVTGQPWTAPAYDSLSVPNNPPRIFCMITGMGLDANCGCLTEQGTKYLLDFDRCSIIARDGQYEPFRDQYYDQTRRMDDIAQTRRLESDAIQQAAVIAPAGAVVSDDAQSDFTQMADYGDFRR